MNNQSIEDFRIASKRTMASLGNDKLDLCHCILGMVSELEEYVGSVKKNNITNISEELADIKFYVVNYITFRNIKIGFTDYNNFQEGFKIKNSKVVYDILVLRISKLSDLVKKYIAYNKTINLEEESFLIGQIITYLYLLFDSHGIDMDKAMKNNVDKLLVRFPLEEGFSDNRATNRDLKSERQKLEQ